MAPTDHPEDDAPAPAEDNLADQEGAKTEEGEEEKPKLDLQVKVDQRSACERHITVTVAREDIDRYFDKEFSELMTSAQVPGFRPGHAPRKLVESRFRKDVGERVKSVLLMDSFAQINEEQELAAISEPDLDLEAVELPKEGPMTFEFDLEVRPEFDLPKWLTVERPVREFTEADVDAATKNLLARYGQLVPKDEPAVSGDYITTNLTFKMGDEVLSSAQEEVIRIRPVLSFRDGKIQGFDKLMEGVRPGETRVGQADITQDAPNESLRGQSIQAIFEILEVKFLEPPELTSQFLDAVGGFESEAELRDAVRDNLHRQLEYQQRRAAREQITAALTVAATWDLPPALLKRQAGRELQRAVMELRSSGFGDDEIRAYENELRQNSLQATNRALKEHFILERIAEEEKIEEEEGDYEREIQLIAAQSGESARRVRAKLEKSGRMDVLRNQIVERKVINRILSHAKFKDVPYQPEATEAEAMDRAAGGPSESEIPEAKPDPHAGAEHPKEKIPTHE